MAINAGDTTYYQAKRGIVQDGLVLNLDAAVDQSYPGNGTIWYDLEGSNSGTLTNGPTFDKDNGGSIVFDGTDDYVSTNFLPPTGTNPRTVSIWYKSDQTQNKNLLGWGTVSNRALWDVLLYQGKVGVHLHSTSAEAGVTYTNNVWQNIVFTYTHPTIKSYMDGVYQTSYTHSDINTGSSLNLNIAKGHYSYFYFNGNIPIVQIYNRELSANEVQQNYNATKGRFE